MIEAKNKRVGVFVVGLVLVLSTMVISGCIHENYNTFYPPSGNMLYVNISNTTMSIDSYHGTNLTLLISGYNDTIRVNSSVPLTCIRFLCEGGNLVLLSHKHHPEVFNITGNSYTYYDMYVWG